MTFTENLEHQLEKEIRDACKKSQRYVGNKAKRPLELISMYGAVETVRRLVSRPQINDAFVDLILAGKTKLTLEYIICKYKYRALFDDAVIKNAITKLTFN